VLLRGLGVLRRLWLRALRSERGGEEEEECDRQQSTAQLHAAVSMDVWVDDIAGRG
jgi:hypothetical protein